MLVKRPRTWEDAVRERGAAVRRDHADRDAAVAHPHALQRRGDDTGTPRGSRGGREGGPRGAARAPADRGTGEAGRRGHDRVRRRDRRVLRPDPDRKSTRLNSSHSQISYAVFCLKKKKKNK